nr:uncharacterized protein LOC113813007 [Penaeus vannamei]
MISIILQGSVDGLGVIPSRIKVRGQDFKGAEGVGAQREHISPSVLKIRQSRSSRRPRCGSSPSSSSWLSPSPSSAPSPWPAVAAEVTTAVTEEATEVTMEVMAVEASAEASEAVEDWEAEEALAEASEAETSEETVTRNT